MNRKIVTGRTQPTSEEVNSLQNFDGIIDGVSDIRRGRKINISLATIAVAISALIVSFWPSKETNIPMAGESVESKTIASPKTQPHQNLEALYPIPKEYFDINPNVDNLIVTSNGTLIDVPKGAFATNENVTLEFKDLSDPMTVFISQIPMDYDSLGSKYHFQSGGMFELTANDNGNDIPLKSGSEIQVSYPTITADEDMNQYRYDVETTKWNYDKPMPLSELDGVCDVHKVDFTSKKSDQEKPPALADFQSQVDMVLGAVPDEPNLASSARYKFHFEFDADDFPELAGFADIMFQAKDSRFKRSFYEKAWDSAELKKGNLGYSIVLKDGPKEENFNVIPVLQKDEYEAALVNYENAKKEAEIKINSLVEAKRAHKDWTENIRNRTSEYTFVSRDKAKVVTNRLVADLERTTLYRTFNLPGLGVVNCDKPIQFPKGVGISADFVGHTEDGLRRFKQVQLIEIDSPTYATYHSGDYDDFRYRKGKQNLILAANHEGRIALGTPDILKGLNVPKGETHQFELKWMKGSFESLDELKAELSSMSDDYAL